MSSNIEPSCGYSADLRSFNRTLSESKAKWLLWRRGKFSPSEISAIKRGLDSWVAETCSKENRARDQVLESLKWARENNVRAWCDIATRSSLPDRKVTTIRRCILRRMLPGSETDRWTQAQTEQFRQLQLVHGPRSWKAIAQETGRTLEDVVNKGRLMLQANPLSRTNRKYAREEALRRRMERLASEEAYESTASRSDCMIASCVRECIAPDCNFTTMYNVPWPQIAARLSASPDEVRLRWHTCVLPDIVRSVSRSLGDEAIMNAYLILRAHMACRGKLTDETNMQIYPASDWYSMQFKYLIPLWPTHVTETRMRLVLRSVRNSDSLPLPDVIRTVYRSCRQSYTKSDMCAAAERHFDQINRTINALADRGSTFLRERDEAL